MQTLQTTLPERPRTSSTASPRASRAARIRRARAGLATRETLHQQLTQIGLVKGLPVLKQTLQDGLKAGDRWLESGADGLGAASLLSAAVDAVLLALFDHCLMNRPDSTHDNSVALFAIGGYGRRVLAPYSDIDLVFVCSEDAQDYTQSIVETMLHTLWDLGLKIGHAYRSPKECVKLARRDHTVRTALLDRRFLAGNAELAHQLDAMMEQEESSGKSSDFILDKLRERDRRHAAEGSSRYRVEPNIKNGKGGLRDLQTLFWIVRYLYGGRDLQHVLRSPAFTRTEASRFRNQTRFLWAVRWHLHRLTGRANEHLSFDVQPELAKRMGYAGRGALSGVERFMKRYFLAAREVGALTRILCAKLEAQDRAQPRGLFGLLPPSAPRDTPEFPGFTRHAGRINVKTPELFEQDPINMLRLFALADKTGLDIHPDAMGQIRQLMPAFPPLLRKDKSAQDLFFEILTSPRHPGRSLQLMNEVGLLGRFVPEFGRIVAQTQYNMYHHFTIDEHTLRAITILSNIENKRLSEAHPLTTRVFPAITHRRALFLAMLLHDTGKGQGDQQRHGARNARTAARRLGLPETEGELVAWLVGHHLEMNATAQRRDLSDPETIARFAAMVGSVERLRLLLLITVADICAVGPGVWNEWKRHLLTMLYEESATALRGGRPSLANGLAEQRRLRAAKAREQLTRKLKTLPDVLTRIEDAYWTAFDEDELLWHAQTLREADKTRTNSLDVLVAARSTPDTDSTAILVVAPDVTDLFVSLAAPIARIGANLVAARLYSCQNGCSLDLFEIQSGGGEPLCADTTQRLLKTMYEAARDPLKSEAGPVPQKFQTRRSAAFIVPAEIALDRNSSAGHLVIEVSGRDRPVLMLDIARILAERNLSIVSAHAENFGARAHEVYYVTCHGGGLPPVANDESLRKALTKIVAQAPPRLPRTRALQRATVSDDH